MTTNKEFEKNFLFNNEGFGFQPRLLPRHSSSRPGVMLLSSPASLPSCSSRPATWSSTRDSVDSSWKKKPSCRRRHSLRTSPICLSVLSARWRCSKHVMMLDVTSSCTGVAEDAEAGADAMVSSVRGCVRELAARAMVEPRSTCKRQTKTAPQIVPSISTPHSQPTAYRPLPHAPARLGLALGATARSPHAARTQHGSGSSPSQDITHDQGSGVRCACVAWVCVGDAQFRPVSSFTDKYTGKKRKVRPRQALSTLCMLRTCQSLAGPVVSEARSSPPQVTATSTRPASRAPRRES